MVFCLVVGVLLTADWMQAGQAKTVRSDTLARLQAVSRQSPDDAAALALATEGDVVARHAYFSSVAFRNAGIWMLIAGLLVMVGCLHLAAQLGRRIDDPRRFPAADQARADREARRALLVAGAGSLLMLAVWATGRAALQPAMTAAVRLDKPAAMTAAVVMASAPANTNRPLSNVFQWSCFRGPRYGVAAYSNAPVAWDGKSRQGVLWRTALPRPGLSSPVLWEGKVFLTLANEEAREVVAFDAVTGAEIWRRTVKDGAKAGEVLPDASEDTGLAAATAACDAAGVYALFGTGDLASFTHDGTLRWQIFLGRPENTYGHASSLWVEDGRIFVQYDQRENSRVLAVDTATGRTLWEKKRTTGEVWSSPVMATAVDGKSVLLLNGKGALSAYEPVSGKELWRVAGVDGEEISVSPTAWNSCVLVAQAGSRMVCYRLDAAPAKVWELESDLLPAVASPVVADGLIFLGTSVGEVTCVDAADGTVLWKHEYETGFYASLAVCGGRVYALDRDGVMHILAVERKFREVTTCPLGEAVDASPAFADGRIFFRTKDALWCVGKK